jgi:hypothetical protein
MSLQQPAAPRRRGGRNGSEKVYTEELAEEILDRLAAGESLAAICSDPALPSEKTVRYWAIDENGPPGFATRYARARSVGYERLADEVIAIGDTECIGPDGFVDNGAVQRARLMSDNRKWLLSKLLPKQFGDKVTQELVGDPNAPIVTRIELVPVAPLTRLPKRRDDGGSDDGSIG